MKKVIIWCVFLIFCSFSLIGCGDNNEQYFEEDMLNNGKENRDSVSTSYVETKTDGTFTESDIISDLQNRDIFATQSINIANLKIIKRQTNLSDKEDIIYVHVEGENNDFQVTRNYKLLYVLYNEGWMLETIEPYTNDDYYDQTIPLHGVSSETVQSYFEDLTYYNPNTCFLSQLSSVLYGEIEAIETNTYYEVYQQTNLYDYDMFQEKIVITISFSLEYFNWNAYIDVVNTPYLKEEAMGRWYKDVLMGWTLDRGLYEGGNEASGYIDVYLASASNNQVSCEIDAWIGTTRYNNELIRCNKESIVDIEYLYDNERNIIGILVCKPFSDGDFLLKITPDGMIFAARRNEWKLQK